MKHFTRSWVIGDDDDQPHAITMPNPPGVEDDDPDRPLEAISMPNPPSELAAQLGSSPPLHRPDRPRPAEPEAKTPDAN